LCEAIYYAAYPGLRWLRHRFGWRSVLAIAFLASVGVAATNVHTLTWPTFGPFGTALILLPVWLLGCACSRSRARDCRRRAAPCRSEAGAFWRGSDAGPARFCTSKRAFPIRKRWCGLESWRIGGCGRKLRMERRGLRIVIWWPQVRGVIRYTWCTTKQRRCFARLPIPNLQHVVMWFGAMFQPGGFVRVLSSDWTPLAPIGGRRSAGSL